MSPAQRPAAGREVCAYFGLRWTPSSKRRGHPERCWVDAQYIAHAFVYDNSALPLTAKNQRLVWARRLLAMPRPNARELEHAQNLRAPCARYLMSHAKRPRQAAIRLGQHGGTAGAYVNSPSHCSNVHLNLTLPIAGRRLGGGSVQLSLSAAKEGRLLARRINASR